MPERPSPWDLTLRRHMVLTLGVVALAAAVFRFPGLGYPEEEYFDEVYHAKTALEYLEGRPPTEWVHPPTAKLLISAGVAVFGYEPRAWRLAPALAGTLLAPVFLLLAWRVTKSGRATLIATALLLLDGVYLVQSRIAMTNVFAVLFQLLAALLLLRAVTGERLSAGRMAAVGLALGLALSTRWTSLWAWGFLALVLLGVRSRRVFELPGGRARRAIGEVTLAAMAFVAIPSAVYLASYIPWITQQDLTGVASIDVGLGRPLPLPGFLEPVLLVIREQVKVWRYHADLTATHNYFSPWWTWPWIYRPTWYFWWSDDAWIRGIVALGNPALWWLSVPAVVWSVLSGTRAGDARRVFAGAGFCFLYLPWVLSPRTLNFSHYLFEALPYACLALGMLLDGLWKGRWRHVARAYLGLVAALFLWFLPLYTALPIPQALWALRLRLGPLESGLWTWFPTWI